MKTLELYDHFDGNILDLWEITIPDTVYKEDVSLTTKDSILTFEVTKTKKSKDPYDWEGPRLIAKKPELVGAETSLGLDFRNCRGNGNVYVRGIGYEFLYLLGIDNPSSDIFFHVFDVNTGRYVPGGRIHHKGHFPNRTTLITPELVSLGIRWEENKTFYSIDERQYGFSTPERLGKTLSERLLKDSRQIAEKGLKEICIKVDLYTPNEKIPSSIKALIDRVDVLSK